ncbi:MULTISPECIES: formate dehydrogenase accessory protein FdhE [Pseudomonas]|uniref:Protein FdhE homolog n=1 Tax=Pseudomonas sp. Hg7Tf TaxID=3236988 RepID=A0AB39I2S1_9PSED|nr:MULTISPECIES: formate dehydrogenase accessory protein FdhE [Pseudomonas]KJK08245.1 formate dehydrogenase [Pseudomonas sp. 5]MDD1976167.1 formate dehydrogenase accessory protein FdhE [Pseudomonas putida]MDH2562070.1 formate dehydrogenase accessory protein FdhE [Pseudomonas sp. Hg5Tf]QYX49211.1 formate dehydrogenase accessory protein FdhE [Pseudomonas sp. S11A 273]
MSSIQMTPVQTPTGGVNEIPPVLLPSLKGRYSKRAERLQQLADAHTMGDYLGFCAQLVHAQQQLLERMPLPPALAAGLADRLGSGQAPLASADYPRHRYWQQLLQGLIELLYADANPSVRTTLDGLRNHTPAHLENLASALLAGDYEQVGSGQALFLWAALSLYFTQLASALPGSASASLGEQRQHCPVCASAPVASVVMTGAQAGLRYLQCSLCECRWHMVRVKCSNCEATGALDYWSLDRQDAALKAESCNDCHSYLKVFYPEKDRDQELLADDLATLALDAEVEREGFGRSGISPFLFPG